MRIITLCYMLLVVTLFLSGCSMFQELQQRVSDAERDLNASQTALEDARDDFEDKQAAADAKQAAIENAIAMGDLETAKLLSAELTAVRAAAAEANERVKDAEDNFDQFGDALTATKNQLENAKGPMDYIYGIASVILGFFGVGGISHGIGQRQRRKIAEQNQLNPSPNRTG